MMITIGYHPFLEFQIKHSPHNDDDDDDDDSHFYGQANILLMRKNRFEHNSKNI